MCPNPLFSIFGQGVHLYGVLIGVGIICAFIVLYFYTKARNINNVVFDFIIYVGVAAIILGFGFASLFESVYEWIETGVFEFNTGITAMGGFIGGGASFIALYFLVGHFVFNKGKNKNIHIKEFKTILCTAPCCITVAHAFGRIGCLMAGCCHGDLLSTSEYVFGGIWMRAADTGISGYYVPTQLYEALFLFVLFAVLSLLYFKKSNLTMPIYLIAYGVWRIFIEFFRTDARGAIVLGLAPSQWQSFVFIAGGVALIIIYKIIKFPFRIKDESSTESKETEETIE